MYSKKFSTSFLILKYIYFYYIFVYIFNLGVKQWSVPLQVAVDLRREQIFEAIGENKFLQV